MSKLLMLITLLPLLLEGGMSVQTQSRTKRELASPLHLRGIRDPLGTYCQRRGGCCPGRNDQCTVPYLDTICYCDLFCNRTVSDCCPDFWSHCLGTNPPYPPSSCERNGHRFHSGATYKENCNLCTDNMTFPRALWNSLSKAAVGNINTSCTGCLQNVSTDKEHLHWTASIDRQDIGNPSGPEKITHIPYFPVCFTSASPLAPLLL